MALTLALFTALMTFIPNFGAIVSLIPPIMLALMDSPQKALYVLLFYLLLQVVEGNLVTPMIQRSAVQLPPALLITGQLLLAVLFGFWGLLLAAPIVAVTVVLVKELYLRDVLGDEPDTPAEPQAA
jgi:predicted PurR-regulated permease PerM